MRAATIRAVALALVAMAGTSERVNAQALGQRVRGAGNGMVELSYAARPGVCGDGRRYFSMGRRTYFGEWTSDGSRASCVPGPARVRLRVERGTITDLKVTVGPAVSHAERATDLGEVGSA